MDILKYIGHEFQVYGVQKYVLDDGKGRGMRFLHIKNGLGLEMHISIDRACDIASVTINGKNVSFMAANGFSAPSFYDDKGVGFLKTFSAGFLTTCGLTQAGTPNHFDGKDLPLHGTISHIPAQQVNYSVEEDVIIIDAQIIDETIFAHKLVLHRTLSVSRISNTFSLQDRIVNRGPERVPLMVLYHINLGYPLISEDTQLTIHSSKIESRDAEAEKHKDSWQSIDAPNPHYVEKCYYHYFSSNPIVSVTNLKQKLSLKLEFDHHDLPYLTQWKMFHYRDYVLGLEPGNCFPDGCKLSSELGRLSYIESGDTRTFRFSVHLETME